MPNQTLLNTTELKPQLFHTQTNTSIEIDREILTNLEQNDEF